MFPKIGVSPKLMFYNGKPYLKWMIWGYHHLRKHPYVSSLNGSTILQGCRSLGPLALKPRKKMWEVKFGNKICGSESFRKYPKMLFLGGQSCNLGIWENDKSNILNNHTYSWWFFEHLNNMLVKLGSSSRSGD